MISIEKLRLLNGIKKHCIVDIAHRYIDPIGYKLVFGNYPKTIKTALYTDNKPQIFAKIISSNKNDYNRKIKTIRQA